MPDSDNNTTSGRVAFLEWFEALPGADESPVNDVDALLEAKNDILPEAVERLRRVLLFTFRGGICPGPMPEELAGFLQRIAVARRRIESGRDPFLGHYGRHGTALEPVPAGRVARFDFRAIRLQLLDDEGWWYNLARAPQSSAVSLVDDTADPPHSVLPPHIAPVVWKLHPSEADDRADITRMRELLETGKLRSDWAAARTIAGEDKNYRDRLVKKYQRWQKAGFPPFDPPLVEGGRGLVGN